MEKCTNSSTGVVNVSEGFKFTKKKDFGAVLVTQGDVEEEYYSDDTLFRHWTNDNFAALRKNYSELFQRDISLWIVTKIYYAQQCSIWCWEGELKEVSLEFGVKTVPGNVDDTGSYSASRVTTTGPGWTHYGTTTSITGTVYLLLSALILD